jgi:hypothetical protein
MQISNNRATSVAWYDTASQSKAIIHIHLFWAVGITRSKDFDCPGAAIVHCSFINRTKVPLADEDLKFIGPGGTPMQ